jgi:TetR/AcrR family transcriptional repressor of nem operon
MFAALTPELSHKAARKQAMGAIATMMGALVMSRVAGTGEFSDEILAAGREAVLDRAPPPKPAAGKPGVKKAVPSTRQ